MVGRGFIKRPGSARNPQSGDLLNGSGGGVDVEFGNEFPLPSSLGLCSVPSWFLAMGIRMNRDGRESNQWSDSPAADAAAAADTLWMENIEWGGREGREGRFQLG